jgi:uncharacterized protein (TIGR02145 family)
MYLLTLFGNKQNSYQLLNKKKKSPMQKKLNQTLSLLVIIGLWTLLAASCKKKEEDTSIFLPAVSTIDATAVALTTAQCGGNVTADNGYFINLRGVCYGKKPDPTIHDSITKNGDSSGAFISKLAGLTPQTKYYFRAYAINEKGISYGSTNSFVTNDSTIKDIENNVYKVVQIGTQVWMAENLRTTKYNDNANIPLVTDNDAWYYLKTPGYCWYDNETSNKFIYGALYNWYTVNTGKLCPTGWHVPTDAEWTTLENYLIANGYNYDGTTIGNKYAKALASTTTEVSPVTGWYSNSNVGSVGNTDYPAKRNATGFTALPSGHRYEDDGSCNGLGWESSWWSATENSTANAWYRCMYNLNSDVKRNISNKELGFSVRCVRDN